MGQIKKIKAHYHIKGLNQQILTVISLVFWKFNVPQFPSEIIWPLGPNGTQVHQRDRKSKEEIVTLGPQRELKEHFDVILPREDKS